MLRAIVDDRFTHLCEIIPQRRLRPSVYDVVCLRENDADRDNQKGNEKGAAFQCAPNVPTFFNVTAITTVGM